LKAELNAKSRTYSSDLGKTTRREGKSDKSQRTPSNNRFPPHTKRLLLKTSQGNDVSQPECRKYFLSDQKETISSQEAQIKTPDIILLVQRQTLLQPTVMSKRRFCSVSAKISYQARASAIV
jgi:hypothetical protein